MADQAYTVPVWTPFEQLLLWSVFFIGISLLYIVGGVVWEILSDLVPFGYHRRPWDPPCSEKPTELQAADLTSIYRTSLRAASCRTARVQHCQEGCEECQATREALGGMFSADSPNTASPLTLDPGSGTVRLSFSRTRGPLNGKGWVFRLSRRQSGKWGLDDVQPTWTS